ncbi:hypothetical protein F4804DRAFT_303685 [Jackrogersella minutella]|nr:hypothetical protein F4804DRAFT_303685 [Jackrogersella minutella]
MIPRRMNTCATSRIVASRLLLQPTAASPRPLLTQFACRSLINCRDRKSTTVLASISQPCSARRIHTSAANMSSAGASSAAGSADSQSVANSSVASTSEPTAASKEENRLPLLQGAEFRGYNRLADHMDMFHSHFRTAWNALWATACAGNSSQNKASSRGGRSIISEGLAFLSQLEMHHNIEETYIFPVLARRMSEFRTDGKGGKGAAELLLQHREIHEGMEGMRKYLGACRDGDEDLDMATLKAQMEGWGSILWKHLDQEVETLGAENMRKYWSVDEIRRIPM